MNTTERVEPTFNGPLSILDTLCRPKAQRCNRLHRSQNVLHAVMQLFQQDALQFPSNLLLCGIDTSLRQQSA